MYKTLKAQAGKVLANLSDLYLLALLAVGLPVCAYLYFDLRAAITVFVITQSIFVIIWKRFN